MAKILVVDDTSFMRQCVIKVVTHLGHEVTEAENGAIAVEKYKSEAPDLVLMDITMPVMDGVTAVKEIMKVNNNAKVIMISSMGQQETVMEAIRSGARDFILKPFQPKKVEEVVAEFIGSCSSSTPTLEEIVSRVDSLPSFPAHAARALELLNDPSTHVLNIAEVLQKDPGLTANILRLANSAYYSRGRSVTRVLEAIVLLGVKTTSQIVVTASSYGILSEKVSGYLLEQGDLWRHSLFVAMAAEAVAKEVCPEIKDSAYMAGLLHDVGKLVLAVYVEKSFAMIIDYIEKQGSTFSEAEKEVLGFSHAKLGAMVLRKWGFPEGIIGAIECHHDPSETKGNRLAGILHVADSMAIMVGMGTGADGMMYEFSEEVFEAIGLSRESFEKVLLQVNDSVNAAMDWAN